MSYRHIENLQASHPIMLFKQVVASEKCDGTSAHIKYIAKENKLTYFHGGGNREQFLKLFNEEKLLETFRQNALSYPENNITIYGEFYGGKIQGQSKTYGKEPNFIAFEVLINDIWLGHFNAEKFVQKFNIEFIPYSVVDCVPEALDAEIMKDSEIAIRRGMGSGHMREGIVVRPKIELIHPNGGRIIYKHKRPEFRETTTKRNPFDLDKQKAIEDGEAIAEEFVVPERLRHILDALRSSSVLSSETLDIKDTSKVISAMISDVEREAKGEIVESKEARKAIGTKTAKLFKELVMRQ